jgi:NADPH2:quinone reductase
MAFRPEVLRASLADLLAMYAAGRLHPHVSHALPLDQVDTALDILRSRKSTGKVVVTMGG